MMAALIRYLLAVIILAILLALGFGVYANWQRDRDADGYADGFTLHVMDPVWWGMAQREARPLVREAKEQIYRLQALWEEKGLLDEAERWFDETRPQRTSSAPDAQGAAGVSNPTRDDEELLLSYSRRFANAMAVSKSALPREGNPEEKHYAMLHQARESLQTLRRDLMDWVPRYEQYVDMDPNLLDFGKELLTRCEEILIEGF